jgi:hypothetical protein
VTISSAAAGHSAALAEERRLEREENYEPKQRSKRES